MKLYSPLRDLQISNWCNPIWTRRLTLT